MALQRMSHTGAAVPTTLVAQIQPTDASLVLASATGWPGGGAAGPFVIVVDANSTAEEKILCSAQTGGNVTVATGGRGWDNTTAALHNAGAPVEHVLAAAEVDDDNAHLYTTTRDDHDQYARTDGSRPVTGVQSFNAGITVTGPTNITGNQTLTGNQTISGTLGVNGVLTASGGLTSPLDASVRSLAATGLTGATGGTRYVGTTASGAPVTGSFNVGDFVVAANGVMWVCIAAGSPGTWTPVGTGLPAPVGTGTTIQSYTDPAGQVWVAKNGVNGGAWRKAQDVLTARVFQTATVSCATVAAIWPFDTVTHDAYGLWVPASHYFVAPVAGVYALTGSVLYAQTAVAQQVQTYFTKNFGGTPTPQVQLAYARAVAWTATPAGIGVPMADEELLAAGDNVATVTSNSVALSVWSGTHDCYMTFSYRGTG